MGKPTVPRAQPVLCGIRVPFKRETRSETKATVIDALLACYSNLMFIQRTPQMWAFVVGLQDHVIYSKAWPHAVMTCQPSIHTQIQVFGKKFCRNHQKKYDLLCLSS